ncbi:hypothetical protein [Phenylobacterium sp.]|uniref:hypothetical protein n=1 Tax=Phenylobacterium sp. TaxID=1871053 RepID=UPI002BD757CB|nr:hypothetical protein [Phenylobacterium sp.]HVI33922.1 hypothetical protein [Phenylobacterium sp.]
MSTLTDMVAAVVMHSSAVAFSHFGVSVEPLQVEKPQAPVERVIARTPRKAARAAKLSDCPETRRLQQGATVVRA